jgi:hypothetical protein
MIRISLYIISLLSSFMTLSLAAQPAGEDYVPPPETESGLRIGVNVVRPLMIFPVPSRFGLEFVGDINAGPNYFLVAEAGFSRRVLNEPAYHLQENGIFLRIGGERNFYNHLNDVIALGGRIGFSTYNRSAPSILVEGVYWDDFMGSLPTDTFFKQWAEVVLTLKTEVFANLFLGWNLRGKLLLFDRKDIHLDNRYIPGFGASSVTTAAGFDFYIYYRIPFKF